MRFRGRRRVAHLKTTFGVSTEPIFGVVGFANSAPLPPTSDGSCRAAEVYYVRACRHELAACQEGEPDIGLHCWR